MTKTFFCLKVKIFIKKNLTETEQAKIIGKVELLEKFGHQLYFPITRKITPELFELRIRGKREIRILYSFIDDKAILLHIFIKKKRKTPKKEIRVALQRLSAILLTT